MIVSYLENHDRKETAAKLLENRDQVIQYLKDTNWTTDEMIGNSWQTDQFKRTSYGKQTDNTLINAKGVKIMNNNGYIYISHFNQFGGADGLMITCDDDEFEISE